MGSLPGIAIGSYSALRVPETVLRVTLAAVLILVAGKIGYQELQVPSPTATALQGDRSPAPDIAIPARDVVPGATRQSGAVHH